MLKPEASTKGASLTNVVIASYFEEEYVRRIEDVDSRLRVLYREDLVPPPRWPGDHMGPEVWERLPENEEALLEMLGEAEVLYDFPRGHVRALVRVAPSLRWVQASMAGAGEVAQKAGLQDTGVTVTTASGVYTGPLAEFVMMALLQHVKDLDRLRRDLRTRHTVTLPETGTDGMDEAGLRALLTPPGRSPRPLARAWHRLVVRLERRVDRTSG